MDAVNSGPSTRASLLMRLRVPRDEQAWAEFTSLYEPVIYRMARRRGMQDADAREVVQDVLMSVAGAIDRFDPGLQTSFRGWLNRVTRNAAIDKMRSLRGRHESIDASGVLRQVEQQTFDECLSEEFESDRRHQLFRWAAGQVRQRTGEVNWMAFWRTSVEGSAAEQVARELNISVGTVYVARCRILKRIRETVHERLAE